MRISPYHSCEISPHAQIYLAIFSLLRNKTRIKFHFSAHQTITEVSICFVFLSLFLSRSLAPFPVILPFFILPWFHFFTAEKREEKEKRVIFCLCQPQWYHAGLKRIPIGQLLKPIDLYSSSNNRRCICYRWICLVLVIKNKTISRFRPSTMCKKRDRNEVL